MFQVIIIIRTNATNSTTIGIKKNSLRLIPRFMQKYIVPSFLKEWNKYKMTGTLKLFKRTQSEIEDGEPTTKAAAASVTTPETAYNAVPYSPESRIFRKIFIMWCFCLPSKLQN